jgi:hypothetical protein
MALPPTNTTDRVDKQLLGSLLHHALLIVRVVMLYDLFGSLLHLALLLRRVVGTGGQLNLKPRCGGTSCPEEYRR